MLEGERGREEGRRGKKPLNRLPGGDGLPSPCWWLAGGPRRILRESRYSCGLTWATEQLWAFDCAFCSVPNLRTGTLSSFPFREESLQCVINEARSSCYLRASFL